MSLACSAKRRNPTSNSFVTPGRLVIAPPKPGQPSTLSRPVHPSGTLAGQQLQGGDEPPHYITCCPAQFPARGGARLAHGQVVEALQDTTTLRAAPCSVRESQHQFWRRAPHLTRAAA